TPAAPGGDGGGPARQGAPSSSAGCPDVPLEQLLGGPGDQRGDLHFLIHAYRKLHFCRPLRKRPFGLGSAAQGSPSNLPLLWGARFAVTRARDRVDDAGRVSTRTRWQRPWGRPRPVPRRGEGGRRPRSVGASPHESKPAH